MVHHSEVGVALCFPGQLQRVPEMTGEERGDDQNLSHPFVERAWETIGFHVPSFSFQGEESDCLNLKLQVVSYLSSMLSFDRYRQAGGRWDSITEHSMGIYAALVAAGAITFEDGLEVVHGIGLILEELGRERPGGMAAVVGLSREDVEAICQELDDGLYLANLNASRHFVVSGEMSSVDKGMELALERGALSVHRLTFNIALHSPLMESIREKVRKLLVGFRINPPQTPVMSHWAGVPLIDPDQIREFLVEQLCRPVDWERCVRSLLAKKITCFVEVGSSDTLTKLIRWIDRDVKAVSLWERSDFRPER